MKQMAGCIFSLFLLGCSTPATAPDKPPNPIVKEFQPLTDEEKRTLLGEQKHLSILMTSMAELAVKMGTGEDELAALLVMEKTKDPLDYEKLGAITAEQFLVKVYMEAIRGIEDKLADRLLVIEQRLPTKTPEGPK